MCGAVFAVMLLAGIAACCWTHVESSKVTHTEAALKLMEEIHALREQELKFPEMQNVIDQQRFKETALDATKRIGMLTESMGDFFEDIYTAVRNIQKKLEDMYKEPITDAFTVDGFDECCNIEENKLEYSADFKTTVTGNMCYRRAEASKSEYVPTSAELKQVMKQNRDESGSVKWQYYGTEVGTIAIYPGHLATDCNEYDPRFRPWYVEVATPSPKDVVLVLDRSSSMDNNDKLTLSKAAAVTVIDTLNPNDRVALVQFSTEAYTPLKIGTEDCYQDQMAFATPEVQSDLTDFVDRIKTQGETRYSNALEKAFELLKSAADEPHLEERKKVILFLTDGGSTVGSDVAVKKLLSDLNAEQGNRVLILTYGIGDEISDGEQLLKDMANMTVYNHSAGDRQVGHFEHIRDVSQLRTKLGSYYNRFTGDFTLYNPIVSVPYVDFFKLGHIFSVCLSVTHDKNLQGVTCVDVLLSDIRRKFDFLEDESIYAFIIDRTGRTLLHPLLPSPGEDIESDPLFVNISVLEPEAQKQGIIDSMRERKEGQQIITKVVVISRGNALFDGTDEVERQAVYSWRQIPGTEFSVCLVVVGNYTEIELESRDHIDEFHYHLLEYNDPKPTMCAHGGYLVTKDFPTYYFSDKAYTDAPLDKDDKPYVDNIAAYLRGEIENTDFDFKPDVKASVAVMDVVASQWSLSFQPFILQKFMGSFQGIYVTFPGKQLSEEFDHTVNSWYKRAKNNVRSTILSRHSQGIRLSQAIMQGDAFGEDGIPWGVMGMDVETAFFQNLLQIHIENCDASDDFSCFLMDNNGYLLFHPDIAPNSTVQHIPIFQYEPNIATSLIDKDILVPRVCTDYAWKDKYHTWKVNLEANPIHLLEDYPYYFFTPVGDTNIYFIMKDERKSSSFTRCGSCPTDEAYISPIRCSTSTCYCACHEEAEYHHCTNSFTEPEGSQPDPPCLKTEDTVDVLEEASQTADVSECYPVRCDGLTIDQCKIYTTCDWCYQNHYSPTKACSEKKFCIYQQTTVITEPTTEATGSGDDKNLVSVIVPIVVVMLLIAGAVIALVMYRKDLTPCNACSKPKVQADGLYTDIPSGGTVNSTAEMIRQESDGSYPNRPLGFTNHSYGSSDKLSVIGQTRSGEPPQYFTTTSAQPVMFVPVQLNPTQATNSSPEVSYLAVGSDLVQAAPLQSLSSSGYASPVPSSTGSQPGSGMTNAVIPSDGGRALPAAPASGQEGGQSPPSHPAPPPGHMTQGMLYMNTAHTGTGPPVADHSPVLQQAFVLTPLSGTQHAPQPSAYDNNVPAEPSDCNAAEVTQHSMPSSSSDQTANQSESLEGKVPQVPSHGYLTTGFPQ